MILRAFRVAVAGACVLSLLLCLGAGWLWWRSEESRGEDRLEFHSRSDFVVQAKIERGFLHIKWWPSRWSHWGWKWDFGPDSHSTSERWRPVGGRHLDWVGTITWVVLPSWNICAAFALPPLLWLGTACWRRFVARRRRRKGKCVSCGYDLTRNVSGTCPECGATTGST